MTLKLWLTQKGIGNGVSEKYCRYCGDLRKICRYFGVSNPRTPPTILRIRKTAPYFQLIAQSQKQKGK